MLDLDQYKNTLKYPVEKDYKSKEELNAARELYGKVTAANHAKFQTDLFEFLGIEKNPKRFMFFDTCWDLGHSYGFSEVFNYAVSLVKLIED